MKNISIEDRTKDLRWKLNQLLNVVSKNEVVTTIQGQGEKFHQYTLDRFIDGKDVKISTIKKIEKFIKEYPI